MIIPSHLTHKEYLCDGVYAAFDGYQIVLITGRYDDTPMDTNMIYVDETVYRALQRYRANLIVTLKHGVIEEGDADAAEAPPKREDN